MEYLTPLHLIEKRNIMQPIKSISIPQPCHQNWNQMTPVEQGRHCTQCSKTVTDFTAMTNAEIINYFARQGNVCGRFGETQLAGLNNYLTVEEKLGFSWKKLTNAAAVTSLFAAANVNAQEPTVGKVLISMTDSVVKGIPVPGSVTYVTVKGKIVDSNDSTALPGVTVRVKGATIGTVTNQGGEFMLQVPSTAGALLVSFIGYESYEAKVSDFANGHSCVSLKMNTMMLGEPVMVMRKPAPFYKVWWYKLKRIF